MLFECNSKLSFLLLHLFHPANGNDNEKCPPHTLEETEHEIELLSPVPEI
jgi:hypothetical protein